MKSQGDLPFCQILGIIGNGNEKGGFDVRKKLLCFLAVCAVLIGVTFTSFAAPESITCPQLSVDVILDEEGTAVVEEHWTLVMDEIADRFSRTVAVAEGQTLSDWELLEKRGEELELPYTPVEEPAEEPIASTLLLTQGEGTTVAEWYFTPEAKTRTFTLGYTVKNAVLRHADIAEYAAAFSNADYPFELAEVQVKIQFPEPAETPSALPNAYLHGTLETEVQYPASNVLVISGSKIPANTALDIRSVLPTICFPEQVSDEETQKEIIEAEETEIQQQAQRAPILTWLFWSGLVVFALAVILAGWIIRKKARRACARFTVEEPFEPSFNPPQQLLPATLPDFYYFYSAKAEDLRGKRVIATLLDLFARGVIGISVNKDDSLLSRDTVVFVKKADLPQDAAEAESALMSLLFDLVGGGTNRCTMADLARYGRHNAATVGERLSDFDRASRRAFNTYGFVDKSLTRNKRTALVGTAVSLTLAVAAALLGAFLDLRFLVLVPALLVSCILSGSCLSLRRLTAEGEKAFLHWHTYRHFLKDFSEAEILPASSLWEPTVINAAALGVLDRVLPQLADRAEEIGLKNAFPHFYPLLEDGGLDALLATASVFDAFPHARLHSYHEE